MFGFIGNIGPWEMIFILVIALIVVGPGKLPEVAKSIGKAAKEFKKATSGVQKEFQDAINLDDKPLPVAAKKEQKEEGSSGIPLDELNKMSLNNKNDNLNPIEEENKNPS
ncbi:MAG: twin-arginine translocase TatA/TatE family subunit [Syntrophomonadaceae bacterium]|nr:twin-arginine translocase TatA/TatE family subunit [Syntrophomonadaceae bacterium]